MNILHFDYDERVICSSLKLTRYRDLADWFGIDSLRAYVPVDIEASEIVPIGLALIVMCLCPCLHWSLLECAYWMALIVCLLMSLWHWSLWDCATVWHWEFMSCTWIDTGLKAVLGVGHLLHLGFFFQTLAVII